MKVKKLNSLLFVLMLSAGYVLADASDNEIFLEQEGDTLALTIDQVGSVSYTHLTLPTILRV